MDDDRTHMQHALRLAARGLGRTGHAPSVGCVLASPGGVIVGRGRTGAPGRPHAEAVALAQAGAAARGATAYVTLEPCSHIGRTGPPCADALIAAGVSRVVAAIQDPDPRVNGGGFDKLRKAGIAVSVGLMREEAEEIAAGFLLRVREQRPLVTLKLARSADNKTAREGPGKWITGVEARRFAHLLRAQNDAILIGVGTALADDPMLDCRLPGLESASPLRAVLDSHLRLSPDCALARSARQIPTLVFTTIAAARDGAERVEALNGAGVEVVAVQADAEGHPDLRAVMRKFAARGIMRLLVEGGATVAQAFLDAGLVDRLELFTAPVILGELGSGEIAALESLPGFRRTWRRELRPDLWESYGRISSPLVGEEEKSCD